MNSPLFVSLPKKSPYTEYFSRGWDFYASDAIACQHWSFQCFRILTMRETGLSDYWTKLFAAEPTQCLRGNYRRKTTRLQSLSFNNLSLAFMILGFGYASALIIFIMEMISNHFTKVRLISNATSNLSNQPYFVTDALNDPKRLTKKFQQVKQHDIIICMSCNLNSSMMFR